MARISSTAATQALSTTGWGFISLHSADPSTTGANEISGGSYSRIAVTWAAAANGSVSNSNAISISVPASTTMPYFGIWSASTAGTYYVGGALSPSISTGSSAGTVVIGIGAIVVSAS